MRIFFVTFIIFLFQITNAFARDWDNYRVDCPRYSQKPADPKLLLIAEQANCVATSEAYKCEDLRNDLEEADKHKVIKCDAKSLKENSIENTNIKECIWNGIKLSADSIADLAGSIVKHMNCADDVDKKREMIKAFNVAIADKRFQVEDSKLGRWLEDAGCAEVEKLLSSRYQNYQDMMMRERVIAINTGKKTSNLPAEQKVESQKGPGILDLLKEVFKKAEVSYQCYTPKVKAEMFCVGVTSLIVDAAAGGSIAMAAKKIAMLIKSKKALARIEQTIAAGEAIDLKDAGKLLNRDRLKAAEMALKGELKRELNEVEKKAIIEAHEIGLKEGRGFYTYTQEDILKKARILSEAGFSKEQIRMLMKSGITGNNPVERGRIAGIVFQKTKLPDSELSPVRREGIVKVIEALTNATAKKEVITLDDLASIAWNELSKTGLTPQQIDKIAKEIDRARTQITSVLSDAPAAAAATASTAAVKPPVAGATSVQSTSGVTLTASNSTESAVNAQRTLSSTSSPSTVASPAKPSGTTGPSTSAKPAAAPAEFAFDTKKLQKVRDEVDAGYLKKKDHVYSAGIDEIPGELTQADIDGLKKITGLSKERDVDSLRNFSSAVRSEDITLFISNPSAPLPQSIKNLKMLFPKLSKDNIEELLAYAKKKTKDEMPEFLDARSRRAQSQLTAIYGKELDIKRTIDLAYDEAKVAQAQLKSWEAKLADPKTPNYAKQGIAEQKEIFKRKLEIEKMKCKKIVDLYNIAYGVDWAKAEYEKKYRETCGTLD